MIRLRARITGDTGSALISGILVSAIVLVLGVTMLGYSVYTNNVSGDDRTRAQALLAAEAAVTDAIQRLETNFPAHGTCGSGPSAPEDIVDGNVAIARYRYEVLAAPGDPACQTNRRLLRAWGYSAGTDRIVRQVDVIVRVATSSGFNRAILAGSALTLRGEVEATGGIHATTINSQWDRMTQQGGTISSPGALSTQPNDSIAGDLWAGTTVTLGNKTSVAGGIRASSGSVTLPASCSVGKAVQAGGTISGTCSPNGGYAPGAPAPRPPTVPLPMFAYNPANYNPAPAEIPSVADANMFFKNPLIPNVQGTFRITDPSATPSVIDLTEPKTITGPTTIIADTNSFGVAPRIRFGGTWQATCTCQLVVVTNSSTTDGVEIPSTGLDLPSSGLSTLIYGKGGVRALGQVRTIFGSIYGGVVETDDDLRIAAQGELANNPPPGFTFPVSSASQWTVQQELDGWKEISNPVLPPGS